jgi:hypothetical protein
MLPLFWRTLLKTLRGLVYGIRSEVDEVTTATWIDHHLEDLESVGIKLRD